MKYIKSFKQLFDSLTTFTPFLQKKIQHLIDNKFMYSDFLINLNRSINYLKISSNIRTIDFLIKDSNFYNGLFKTNSIINDYLIEDINGTNTYNLINCKYIELNGIKIIDRNLININNTYYSKTIKYSKELITFKNYFNIESPIHEHSHTFRVMTLVLKIGENILNKHNVLLAFISALIHDMYRIDDGDDNLHGIRSAENKLQIFNPLLNLLNLNTKDIDIIKKSVSNHSLKEELDINDESYECCAILKDADALDRVRLGSEVDINYLRLNSSKQLVNFAFNLYIDTFDFNNIYFINDYINLINIKTDLNIYKVIKYLKI